MITHITHDGLESWRWDGANVQLTALHGRGLCHLEAVTRAHPLPVVERAADRDELVRLLEARVDQLIPAPATLDLFGAPRHRVEVWAGYQFGAEAALDASGLRPWLTGLVVTPRYAARCAREITSPIGRRIILDNGAYPAWASGTPLSLTEQFDGLAVALTHLTPEWVVVPDVVADAEASWQRTIEGVRALEPVVGGSRLLLAVQDGMVIEDVAALARELGGGVFVGGSGWRYKSEALTQLQRLDVRHVHVGRASQPSQLRACCDLGAQSCDSTTYLRQQHHNTARAGQWRAVFERHARRA